MREKAGKKKKDDRTQSMQRKKGKLVSGEGVPGGKILKVGDRRERGHSERQERSFADVISDLTRQDLTRLPSQTTSSRWQVDKEAIGLSRVQQFSHLYVGRPFQISINSMFKHIHTTGINTIIWQFVPFIYHPQ